MSENTFITTASGYDTKRMIFSDAQSGSIPNSVPPINYRRITIQTRNENGTVGDLILSTTKLFSFGVSENSNPETGKVNGYIMPLCLWNRDSPTQEEKDWSTTFDNIIEACKDHLVANKEEIEQYDLAKSDLKKFNPLYWKRDKGKIVEGSGPTLYAKLIVSKKQDKIITMFYDSDGESVDPLSLLGKYCFAKSAVKIESIFIGNKISMQVKLYECEVKLMETGMKRLLRRPNADTQVKMSITPQPLEQVKDVDNDAGSVNDSDSDEEDKKPAAKPVPAKRVTKIVRRKQTDQPGQPD
jgi:hypothetical protein